MTDDNEFFVDLSVLVDYCRVHDNTHQKYAISTLEYIKSEGGRVTISQSASEELTTQITNRYRLLTFLIDSATELLKVGCDSPEMEYKATILNISDINNEMDFDVTNEFQSDINELRSLLDDKGLNRFRTLLDEYTQKLHSYQIRLREFIISRTFSSNRSNWQAETAFNSISSTEVQAESLLDAVFWTQETLRDPYIVSGQDDIYEKSGEINRSIKNIFSKTNTLNIFSPLDFVEHYDINPSQYVLGSILSD